MRPDASVYVDGDELPSLSLPEGVNPDTISGFQTGVNRFAGQSKNAAELQSEIVDYEDKYNLAHEPWELLRFLKGAEYALSQRGDSQAILTQIEAKITNITSRYPDQASSISSEVGKIIQTAEAEYNSWQ